MAAEIAPDRSVYSVEETLSSLKSTASARVTAPQSSAMRKSKALPPKSREKNAAETALARIASQSGCGLARLSASNRSYPSARGIAPVTMPREISLTRATWPRFVVRTLMRMTSQCGTPSASTKE